MQAQDLIEAVKRVTTSDAETARALGVTFQEVSGWKHGRRTCPPDMRARLAAIAGLDPVAEMVEGLAEGLNEQRRAGLLEALAKSVKRSRHTPMVYLRHYQVNAHLAAACIAAVDALRPVQQAVRSLLGYSQSHELQRHGSSPLPEAL